MPTLIRFGLYSLSVEKCINHLAFIAESSYSYRIETPEELLAEQESQWGRVLDFIETRYHFRPPITTGFASTSIPKESRDFISRHLLSFNRWGLVG